MKPSVLIQLSFFILLFYSCNTQPKVEPKPEEPLTKILGVSLHTQNTYDTMNVFLSNNLIGIENANVFLGKFPLKKIGTANNTITVVIGVKVETGSHELSLQIEGQTFTYNKTIQVTQAPKPIILDFEPKFIQPGTTLTIKGQNFTAKGIGVQFPGLPFQLVSVKSNEILLKAVSGTYFDEPLEIIVGDTLNTLSTSTNLIYSPNYYYLPKDTYYQGEEIVLTRGWPYPRLIFGDVEVFKLNCSWSLEPGVEILWYYIQSTIPLGKIKFKPVDASGNLLFDPRGVSDEVTILKNPAIYQISNTTVAAGSMITVSVTGDPYVKSIGCGSGQRYNVDLDGENIAIWPAEDRFNNFNSSGNNVFDVLIPAETTSGTKNITVKLNFSGDKIEFTPAAGSDKIVIVP